ncbi:MAG: Crp/Fnr family transcriptional regulator [Bacteroidota bacterium]
MVPILINSKNQLFIDLQMQALAQHMESQIAISKEKMDLVLNKFTENHFAKKEYLLQAGKISNYVFFISSGCVRTYITDYDGIEHNIFFPSENWWAGDLQSFIDRTPASCNIQALEDTITYSISQENWHFLTQNLPEFLKYAQILFRNNIIEQQKRITQYLSFTASERYQYFVEHYPHLVQRIAQKHIASYLGITPEFLSILRNQKIK